MEKSHISFTLAVALAAALLAGCGSPGSFTEASGPKEVGSQSQIQDTGSQGGSGSGTEGAPPGEITLWHSFAQGPRLETIQETADKFMEENPDVKINIETFLWNGFYTKWTTGLASGSMPDMGTASPARVVEMISADALTSISDLIDDIGRGKFVEAAIFKDTMDGNNYSVPLYRHVHMMWIRKDLLGESGLEVPKTWDELYDIARVLTKDDVYGLSFPYGTSDFRVTFFLDFYVRGGGGSLLIDDLRVNLISDLAINGINYWLKAYDDCPPKGSISFDVLDQATLYYQGKTTFGFSSGFQIPGVVASSPDLFQYADYYPTPEINVDDPDEGIMITNTPTIMWKASKHPEICRAFMKTLYDEDTYVEFLHVTPAGVPPAIKGIADTDAYEDDDTIRQSTHVEEVLIAAADIGTALGYEHGPSVQVGIMQNNHVIEDMFQDITTNETDVKTTAEAAEDKLNALFEIAG